MGKLNAVMMAHPAAIVLGSLAALAAVMVTARDNALAANDGFQAVKSTSEGIVSALRNAEAALS